MPQKIIIEESGRAQAEHDVVHLEGPSGIDIALTPEAAMKTAKEIDDAAVDAILNRHTGAG